MACASAAIIISLYSPYRYGPTLPEGSWGHAIARFPYNNEPLHYMLIGGAHPHHKPIRGPEEDEHSKTTYIYNGYDLTWRQGPDLNHGRLYHAAGTIQDSVTNEIYVVVTGGQKGGPEGTLDSVELLLPNYNYWVEGRYLFC